MRRGSAWPSIRDVAVGPKEEFVVTIWAGRYTLEEGKD